MDGLRRPARGDESIEETFTYPRKSHLTSAPSDAVPPSDMRRFENTIEGETECKSCACDLRHVPEYGRNCRLRLNGIAKLPAALNRPSSACATGALSRKFRLITAGKPFRVMEQFTRRSDGRISIFSISAGRGFATGSGFVCFLGSVDPSGPPVRGSPRVSRAVAALQQDVSGPTSGGFLT